MREFTPAPAVALLVSAFLFASTSALAQDAQGGVDSDSTFNSLGGSASDPRSAPGDISATPQDGRRNPGQDRPGSSTPQPSNRRGGTHSDRRGESPWEQRDAQRPVFLSGRVVMAGGEAPPQPVVVKMGCGGNPSPRAYTDAKGRFSFQANDSQPLMAVDAGAGSSLGHRTPQTGPFGRMNLFHCHLVADLPGYRSDRLALGSAGSLDRNDVGTIVLHRLEGLEGHTVSATTLAAPREAKSAYGKGIRTLRRMPPNYEKSIAHLEKAVKVYPEFAEAWAALGEARLGADDLLGAKEALTRSIEADPKLLRPYQPLMQMAFVHSEWDALASLSERYLKLSAASGYARYLAATASAQVGRLDQAESLVRQLKDQGDAERWPLIHVVMAMVYESRAQFERAATEYETFLGVSTEPTTIARVKRILHDWQALGVVKPRNQDP